MEETLNGWKVTLDKKEDPRLATYQTHFVAKRGFDIDDSGLSLMVDRTGKDRYMVELAIEVNNSVYSCFRIENNATEKEAIDIVENITSEI
jgi:hypothetical protein